MPCNEAEVGWVSSAPVDKHTIPNNITDNVGVVVHKFQHLRGHVHVTSTNFFQFLDPLPRCPNFLLLHSTKSTQPPLLLSDFGLPQPPSPLSSDVIFYKSLFTGRCGRHPGPLREVHGRGRRRRQQSDHDEATPT